MNRAQKNNNPLNLRFAHQTEATGQDDKGFAVFPSPMAGWRAAHAQIRKDQKRKMTLSDFIFKFAPPNENETNDYLAFVLDQLNELGDAPLAWQNVYALSGVMAQYEGYYSEKT